MNECACRYERRFEAILADVEEHKRTVANREAERDAEFGATEEALRGEIQELTGDLAAYVRQFVRQAGRQ